VAVSLFWSAVVVFTVYRSNSVDDAVVELKNSSVIEKKLSRGTRLVELSANVEIPFMALN
jgi:hypothetical protein